MNTFRLFFFALLIFVLKACTSDDLITMEYQMTQCADPWMEDGKYFNDKEGTLEKFLEQKGVEVESLKIVVDCSDMATCTACTCLGCDYVTVKAAAEDEAILKELGFTRI